MDLSTYFEPIDTAIVDFQSREFRSMLGDDILAYTERGRFTSKSPSLCCLV